jgi:hypothetical protein
MTTAGDIVTDSLKKAGILGVGKTALAEDMTDGFNDLNDMLAQWQRKRWLVWHLVDYSVVSTGSQSYTVGIGGDFNVTRPDKLEAAYLRQIQSIGNQVDYILEIIEAREDYSAIPLKSLVAFTGRCFYDSAYPMGSVYPYPIPNASIYELHIVIKEQLGQFANLAQVIALPLEYYAALKWNLAARLRISYRMPVDAGIVAMAKDALNVIRTANTQIPRLKMPGALRNRGVYNIYSDTVY